MVYHYFLLLLLLLLELSENRTKPNKTEQNRTKPNKNRTKAEQTRTETAHTVACCMLQGGTVDWTVVDVGISFGGMGPTTFCAKATEDFLKVGCAGFWVAYLSLS